MRLCYFTGCTYLFLSKMNMDREILILFQNKYYCLPVLNTPVFVRHGNRERKSSCIHFFIPVKKHEVSLCFLPYFFAPLDVNRNSTIKTGRRLSQTPELYTEKWNMDEEKRLIALFVLLNL